MAVGRMAKDPGRMAECGMCERRPCRDRKYLQAIRKDEEAIVPLLYKAPISHPNGFEQKESATIWACHGPVRVIKC